MSEKIETNKDLALRVANEMWREGYPTFHHAAVHFERCLFELAKQREPATYEFQDREGNWKPFIDSKHFENTVEDGSWPIRALYADPVPHSKDDAEHAAMYRWLRDHWFYCGEGDYIIRSAVCPDELDEAMRTLLAKRKEAV